VSKETIPDLSTAWKEFAKLHPKRWHRYLGGCDCYECERYRQDFEQWVKGILSKENP